MENENNEISQREKNIQNNANNIRNAADVAMASNIPHAAAAGAAVKTADKLSGGEASERLGEVLERAGRNNPVGQQLQNASNNLSESGVSDQAGQIARTTQLASGNGEGLEKDSLDKKGGKKSLLNSNNSDNDNTNTTETSNTFFSGLSKIKKILPLIPALSFVFGIIIFIVLIAAKVQPIVTAFNYVQGKWNEFTDYISSNINNKRERKYYEKLESIQKKYLKKGICIDVNIITAALTAETDFETMLVDNDITEEEMLPDEDDVDIIEEDENEDNDADYKKMTKYVKSLAKYQLIYAIYELDEGYKEENGSYCKASEEKVENTSKESTKKNKKYYYYYPAYNEDGSCEDNYAKNELKEVNNKDAIVDIGDKDTMEDTVFYWYLTTKFIPKYYKKELPSNDVEKQEKIYKIAQDIYLLYEQIGPSKCPETSYAMNSNYNFSCVNSEGVNLTNPKVQLLQCSDGNVKEPIDGEELVDLETYITGVVYAEIGGTPNYEALKTQAVAARTYLMTSNDGKETNENGETIFKIRNCDERQVYCDPAKGCWRTDKTMHSGEAPSGIEQAKPPLATSNSIYQAVKDTLGQVLYNADGKIMNIGYNSTIQNGWSASEGTYLDILAGTYPEMAEVSSECHGATGDWANWKQYADEYKDAPLGHNGAKLGPYGCYVTSIAILIARSGTPTTIELNPRTFAEYLTEKNSFDKGGSCTTLSHIPEIAPGFSTSVGVVSIKKDLHSNIDYIANSIREQLVQGKYVQIWLATYNSDGDLTYTHFIAVDRVEGNTIYINDPGSSCTVLNNCYKGKRVENLRVYTIN